VQLKPRYDGPPVVRFDGLTDDLRVPLLRQRHRLADALAGLDDDAWSSPSRCDGWGVRDVVSHLVTTNGFWAYSITAGRAGDPSRVLDGFDPVATPAALVDADQQAPAEVLAAFVDTNQAMADALADMDEEAWSATAEAPPGHVGIRSLVLHGLWDSWIHERDVLLPLGADQELENDEVTGALRYAAALGPGFLAMSGSERPGTVVVRATDPQVEVVVQLGPTVVVSDGLGPGETVVLTGDAVELVEALSFRGPFPEPLDSSTAWMFGGLAEVFDTSLDAEAARYA
jgi:uncharacterized protein (TIGR03083 family)